MMDVLDGRVESVAPERSLSQRMEALAWANETRSRRAQLKRDLKHGRVRATDVVAEPPPLVESMKVFDLLLAVPKIGRVKAETILRRNLISPSKSVAGLSERQRRELLLALAPYVSVRRGTMDA